MHYKLTVISDVHGATEWFQALVPTINASDYFIFCGDGWSALRRISPLINVPMACVRGNTDFDCPLDDLATINLGGTKALVTHGHRQNAKQGIIGVLEAAKNKNCALAFHGHTHIFYDRIIDGVHIICPGALLNGSYAIVEGDGTDFTCTQKYI